MKLSHQLIRGLWIAGGIASLIIGIIGIVLPLLPTTPLLLLAAFCFARGSDRLNNWLLEHPTLGPPIHDWRKYGAISASAKFWAVIVIVATPPLTWLFGAPLWAIGAQLVVLAGVCIFILTRPVPPE